MQDQVLRSQSDLVVQLRTAPCEEVPESRRILKVSSSKQGGETETEVAVFTQAEITHPLKEKIFNVTKDNMADMYEASSWGWSDEKKWQSINNTALRFILAFREPSEGRWGPTVSPITFTQGHASLIPVSLEPFPPFTLQGGRGLLQGYLAHEKPPPPRTLQ